MELRGLFTPAAEERIGIEVECGLLDERTGQSAPYEGPCGSRALLERARRELGAEPIVEGGALVGVQLADGAQLSLELGGAIEYSSAPYPSLGPLVATARRDLRVIAGLAARSGLALLPGGLVPFTPRERIPWAPKPRIDVMRRYFRGLGPAAAFAENVMGLTLSTQTTLDYLSAEDFRDKLTLLVKAAPIAAALFVNSAIEEGRPSGVLSRRMQMWGSVDPSRCGVLGFAVRPDVSFADVVEWGSALPMIYRRVGDGYVPGPERPFGELVEHGFGDGTAPGLDDWRAHLSQVWPQVRARHTLEMRAFDGLPWEALAAGPAFCVGLAYHAPARRAALALLDGLTADDLAQASEDVAVKGLDAMAGDRSVGATAEALLGLARQGLRARVAEGREQPGAEHLLDPLDEVVRGGVTFAERAVSDWTGPMRERPAALVAAGRVPVE
ncbi:glutamate-cysteine ligase family protein [Phytohabitans sp. ZYX-F-186]|uniref:Glutamate--cysteine ligase n=1 Tax=Phytohabitans maris TaxID=3071409 RepID=A0ABU0Z802_9ACTN|nr:glutamate-cysteine ligase family protein [Phytohabitans sp. ZYX-F-186]MDQ7903190.1 glutamate-cysteine ligase family protein [Phytohabitans sp. ZYX-F-186]